MNNLSFIVQNVRRESSAAAHAGASARRDSVRSEKQLLFHSLNFLGCSSCFRSSLSGRNQLSSCRRHHLIHSSLRFQPVVHFVGRHFFGCDPRRGMHVFATWKAHAHDGGGRDPSSYGHPIPRRRDEVTCVLRLHGFGTRFIFFLFSSLAQLLCMRLSYYYPLTT